MTYKLATSRGAALISVLWVITVLTSIAATATMHSRTDVKVSQNLIEGAKVRQILDGGIRLGVESLVSRSRTSVSPGAPLNRSFKIDGHLVKVSVKNESGRIDLNASSRELLFGLLIQYLSEEQADFMADAILDWRDRDDDRRIAGAEARDYYAAGRSYPPSNGKFLGVEELRFVIGVNDDLLSKLQADLTVFSGQPGVFPVAASVPVLVAAGGIVQESSGSASGRSSGISGLRRNLLAARPGNIYRIETSVDMANGRFARAGTVIRFEPTRRPEPFVILASDLDVDSIALPRPR